MMALFGSSLRRLPSHPGSRAAGQGFTSRLDRVAGTGGSHGRRSVARKGRLPMWMLAGGILWAVCSFSPHSWGQGADAEQNPFLPRRDAGRNAKAAPDVVPPPKGITYSTRLDHTAVWVGDQFHYMVMVDYTPEFEFVLDNLTKETVNMDPFQVTDVAKKVTVLKNTNKRLFVDMTLASFGTGQAAMQIPQFTLYYFRKDHQTTGVEQAAAESLTIPGPVIAPRSTLPPDPTDIRDAVTVNSWSSRRWVLAVAGWVSAVILGIGLLWELLIFVRSTKTRKGPDRRKAMEAVRARWASAVPSDFSDPKTTTEFYTRSYQDVKEYIGYYLETPTLGLTAEELSEELQRLNARPELTEKVVKLLGACEAMRYAPGGNGANSQAAPAIAQDVREILSFGLKG